MSFPHMEALDGWRSLPVHSHEHRRGGDSERAADETIRYYGQIDLVTARCSANGYRDHDSEAVRFSDFVAHAHGLGFSIGDCHTPLALWRDRNRVSADVRAIAKQHLNEIDRKIVELQAMRRSLADLVTTCHGDNRPNCPSLNASAYGGTPSPEAAPSRTRPAQNGA